MPLILELIIAGAVGAVVMIIIAVVACLLIAGMNE